MDHFDLAAIGLSILTFLLLVLAIYVRTLDVSVAQLKSDTNAFAKYLDDIHKQLPEVADAAKKIRAFEADLDALDSKYKTIRGTVARLSRSDMLGSEREPAPPPTDEAARLAEKEQLRERARAKGMLR